MAKKTKRRSSRPTTTAPPETNASSPPPAPPETNASSPPPRAALLLTNASPSTSHSPPQETGGASHLNSSGKGTDPVSASRTKNKPRIYTQMTHLWGLEDGKTEDIRLNEKGQPMDGEYAHFLGTVVRRPYLCPINFLRWTSIPQEYKDSMWANEIEPRFKFYPAEHAASIREWTMGSMKNKWRSWKNSLKKTCFDFSKSEDDNVKFVMKKEKDRVDSDQYRFLVKYWLSDKGKVTSETNKNNISCYKEPHCAGSMAFCRVAENLAKENDGVKPARSLMYCHTRKNKKRDYTSTTTSKYGDEFEKAIATKNAAREKRIQEREENPDLNLDSETSSREESLDNDDYSRIKGKSKGTNKLRGTPCCFGEEGCYWIKT